MYIAEKQQQCPKPIRGLLLLVHQISDKYNESSHSNCATKVSIASVSDTTTTGQNYSSSIQQCSSVNNIKEGSVCLIRDTCLD